MPVKTKIKLRRDTAANWTSTNPVLASGEMGYATDIKVLKTGDGFTAWNLLPVTAQSGSSAVIPYTNPQGAYLTGSGLYLPAQYWNTASSPDATSLKITGDIDIQCKVSAYTWFPWATWTIVSKRSTTADSSLSYSLTLTATNGFLRFGWWDGTTAQNMTSTVAPGFAANVTKWVRFTLDVNDGAGNKVGNFYTSDDGVNWTQLGATVTSVGTTALVSNTSTINIGSDNAGFNTSMWAGTIYRVKILNGINGIVVYDANFETAPANALAFAASSDTGIKSGGLTLRAISGQFASTSDSAALSVTGDIDIKVKASLIDWTPAVQNTLIHKYGTAGQRSFWFDVTTGGSLRFRNSSDGTAAIDTISDPLGFTDGTTKWVRVTMDVNDGAGNRVVKFYTSDDGLTWTQLGTTVTIVGTTSIFDSTTAVEIGSGPSGSAGAMLNGTIYRIIMQSSYDTANNTTSVVFDKDFSEEPSGTTTMYGFSTTGIGENGLILNGTSGQSASALDANALDIIGDMEIVTRVAPTTWTPASAQRFTSKSHSTTNQRSWNLTLWTNGTIILYASADGVSVSQAQSTVAVGGVNGQPIWLKVTRRKSDGRVQFFKANDQATEPTSWTQIGTDVNILVNSDLFSGSATVEFGGSTVDGSNFSGTIYRSILRNGIDGTTVLDANFENQKMGIKSFTESSINNFTIFINGITPPVITINGGTDHVVTINTSKYSFGLPNFYPSSSGITSTAESTSAYGQIFNTSYPISVDMCAFEVTVAPTVESTVRIAVYSAGNDMQPTGSAIIDFGYITVNAGSIGVFYKQISAIKLQPGNYFIIYKISSGMSFRFFRGGPSFAHATQGANPFISQYFFPSPNLAEGTALPISPKWTFMNRSSSPTLHAIFLRWSIL